MALAIKICIAAILCCTVAFARADSDEALQPYEWERSRLSETAVENDLFEEIPEYDLTEENVEKDLPEEDYQTQEENENVDSTRIKRQIIFPRPTPTFPYQKGPFTYPNLPRRPYLPTIRSAEDVSPPSEIVCTPPFVRCNPAQKNCRPFGPCRPPPFLPQYPQRPRYY